MNKYFSYLILLILVSCSPRIVKLKCDAFSTRVKVDSQWTQFSDWQPRDFRVHLKKEFLWVIPSKLVIYDEKKVVYKIDKMVKTDTTEKGEEYISFQAKDDEGLKCMTVFINKGQSVYVIIYYDDVNYCYNLTEEK